MLNKQCLKKQTKSFTLIEVLVGIVVVGILSSFIIVSVSSFIDDANDGKRKKDLDSIATSLLTYKTLTGSYPIEESDCNIGDGTCLDELTESGYATNFPIDPDGTRYTYTSDGTTYTIKASLSNNQTLSYNPDTGYSEYQGLAGLEGYAKRKSITIASSASLTNYQMKFIVHRSDGSDDEENVYIGSSGCESDYDDIRFTNSSNQLLDYWIESSDSSSATIWVEADSLASGNTTLYLYYGNSSETTVVSNGNNTFDFFDDFSGASIDSTKWNTRASYGSVSISGDEAYVEAHGTGSKSYATLITKSQFAYPFIVETSIRVSGVWSRMGTRSNTNPTYDNFIVGTTVWVAPRSGSISTSSILYINEGNTITGDLYGNLTPTRTTIKACSGNTTLLYDTEELTRDISYNDSQNYFGFECFKWYNLTTYGKLYIDFVAFRKYTSPEPSASWGLEENF